MKVVRLINTELIKKRYKIILPVLLAVITIVISGCNRPSNKDIERAIRDKIGEDWFTKDLVIMPFRCECGSKINSVNLARRLIDFAHSYGFDVIVAYIILDSDELKKKNCCRDILKLNWDKRWELYNPRISQDDKSKIQEQCEYLAVVLLQRICSELKC